jgi:type IV pilus assembly protein PilA
MVVQTEPTTWSYYMKQALRASRGFTLIELMIVIAILGILLAIAIPAYSDYTVRARVSEGLNVAAAAKSAVSETRLSNGTWPETNAAAGMPVAISSTYVASLAVGSDGTILITYETGDGKIPELGGANTMVLAPSFSGNTIRWECTANSTVETRFRPARCRP